MKIFEKENPIVGIIGGKGGMGSFFAKIFENKGIKVLISDIDTELSNIELTEKSDIIIISVPILKTKEVIAGIIGQTHKDQILMDLTSLKCFPIEEMLKGKAEVIGLHPMFGPSVDSIENQAVVFCPARTKHQKEIRSFFEDLGANIKETSAEEHDKMMAYIQVMIHFHTILMGRMLSDMKPNLEEMQHYMSPVYRLEFDVISRIFSQDPNLYGPILMLNPFTKDIMNSFTQNTDSLKNTILSQDLNSFCQEFLATRDFLGEFCKKASDESTRIISYLNNL